MKMAHTTVTLSLQLLCQLIGSTSSSICDGSGSRPVIRIENATLPDGYTAYPDIGVAYKVHNEIVSWRVARKECIIEGGHLALIDSYTKLHYVLRQRKSKNFTHVGILRMYDDEWIGLSTGLPVSEIVWAPGEPSGTTDCVMIKEDQNGLANYKCTTRGDFVCELPIPPKQIVKINSEVGAISIN